jgi:hypothetical protein
LVKWLAERQLKAKQSKGDEEEYENTVMRRTRKAKKLLDTVGLVSLTAALSNDV